MSAVAFFDAATVSADAIERAAYRLSDRLAVETRCDGSEYRCEVWAADTGGEPSDADMAHFRIEVTDQNLRARIRSETENVRNLILAVAFSNVHVDIDEQPS